MDLETRINIWKFTSDLVHDLFIEIYGDYNNFIKTSTIHPLEEYIITYDENMED